MTPCGLVEAYRSFRGSSQVHGNVNAKTVVAILNVTQTTVHFFQTKCDHVDPHNAKILYRIRVTSMCLRVHEKDAKKLEISH